MLPAVLPAAVLTLQVLQFVTRLRTEINEARERAGLGRIYLLSKGEGSTLDSRRQEQARCGTAAQAGMHRCRNRCRNRCRGCAPEAAAWRAVAPHVLMCALRSTALQVRHVATQPAG